MEYHALTAACCLIRPLNQSKSSLYTLKLPPFHPKADHGPLSPVPSSVRSLGRSIRSFCAFRRFQRIHSILSRGHHLEDEELGCCLAGNGWGHPKVAPNIPERRFQGSEKDRSTRTRLAIKKGSRHNFIQKWNEQTCKLIDRFN